MSAPTAESVRDALSEAAWSLANDPNAKTSDLAAALVRETGLDWDLVDDLRDIAERDTYSAPEATPEGMAAGIFAAILEAAGVERTHTQEGE